MECECNHSYSKQNSKTPVFTGVFFYCKKKTKAYNKSMEIIGYIFIGIGVIDFLIGNFGNMNLTSFLGPLSSFSPLIFGGIGALIIGASRKK